MSTLSHRFLAVAWAALVVTVAVHNLEEWWLDMSGWLAGQSWLALPGLPHGDRSRLGVALILVTATVTVVAVVAVVRRASWSAMVLSCVCWAALINVASHLTMTVVSVSLMPGTITGVVIVLPVCAMVLRRLPTTEWTTRSVVITVAAALFVAVGSLGVAALLR